MKSPITSQLTLSKTSSFITNQFQKTQKLFTKMISDDALVSQIELAADICYSALKNGKKIMFCGNGGSAADSQHLAAEFVSKLSYDRPALNAIALTTDTSALTAIGNDYGYLHSFSRQVEALGQSGDVLVGISTSGRSKNVLEAIKSANNKNITTIAMLGDDGRDIGEISGYQINIPSSETPKIQEGHIATGHILCALVEDSFFGKTHNPNNKS